MATERFMRGIWPPECGTFWAQSAQTTVGDFAHASVSCCSIDPTFRQKEALAA
jgi:hypothetical protein